MGQDFLIGKEDESVKIRVETAVRAARVNMLNFIVDLPQALKNLQDTMDARKAAMEKFEKAQEGGAVA